MVKLKIGLYKHKRTGKLDVMIDEIDNNHKVHNGEFEKIKEFEHEVKEKKEGWVNVYKNENSKILLSKSPFETKEEAMNYGMMDSYLDTVKIEWEE